jgi:hypothetical protein
MIALENPSKMVIPENLSKLVVMEHGRSGIDAQLILEPLKRDCVVLISGADADGADRTVQSLAEHLGIGDSLELQAGFAGYYGHRQNIGQYFMSVNKRGDYQFIPPHSEGDSFSRMQLASFFCYENSTDGGESLLMNVDDSSKMWLSLRESARRGRLNSKSLAAHEISRARGLYKLNLPADVLRKDDQILRERPTDIAGLTAVDVLARPQTTYCRILDRRLYAFWDSTASIYFDLSSQYAQLLRQCGLLREPKGGMDLLHMDSVADRHISYFGEDFSQLFKCRITRKLVPGDLIIQNNLTWTHSASNWTPGSGIRKIAASFA